MTPNLPSGQTCLPQAGRCFRWMKNQEMSWHRGVVCRPEDTEYKLVQEGQASCRGIGCHWRFRKVAIDRWLEDLPAATRAAQAGATRPQLQEPIKDPARFEWHEVTKVAHYYLSVDALTQPMQVREGSPPYGELQ